MFVYTGEVARSFTTVDKTIDNGTGEMITPTKVVIAPGSPADYPGKEPPGVK